MALFDARGIDVVLVICSFFLGFVVTGFKQDFGFYELVEEVAAGSSEEGFAHSWLLSVLEHMI